MNRFRYFVYLLRVDYICTLMWRWGLILIIVLTLNSSCSKFRKIQKSNDWEVKYSAAMDYYEKEDYYKAGVLFEELLPILRGSKEAEKASYYYAYSQYHQKQYVSSSHYFETFYQTYNRSEFAQEAMFMHAYSLYLESPDPMLDQSSTLQAVQAMQVFINRYPTSEFRQQSSEIIDELQRKLEKKSFENAKQYHKLNRFKAALVAFEIFKKEFPDSNLVEEVDFLMIDSQYQLAVASIYSKKRERYLETIELYQEFVDDYPESQFLKPAENLYKDSIDQIDKIARINN